ncbi:MAG: guanylate kinase [Acidobacteria bacterium CG_4_9_14_3_um_filter_49_7]|nr:MAG: guanylate kinase [Acidobacteria bacterium CG_4_9_14_3_um_filter_49_7]
MKIDRNGGLFIISAPSGSGKSTVIHHVMEAIGNLSFSISYTTREPRAGEINGREYFFVSESEFEEMIEAGEFLEHARVFGKFWYGTNRKQVNSLLDQGNDVIMDIDVQGALQLMEQQDIPHTSLFIIPPDADELKVRLQSRNREGDAEIQKRLKTAGEEIQALASFDYVVVNDDLDKAVADVKGIVLAQRLKVSRVKNIEQLTNVFQMEGIDD